MFLRITQVAIFFFPWSIASFAGNSTTQELPTLDLLAKNFAHARQLSPGSRPPPPRIKIATIIGLKSSSISKALGIPDRPTDDYDFECGAPICWVYTYGPKDDPAVETPVVAEGADVSTITVTTGGPFILILGIAMNRVVTAQWQGQR